MTEQIVTEPFSAGYELVHGAEVHTLNDEEAIMDFEMFNSLEAQFGDPLVGYVGGLHYHFKPERAIPPSAIAVPADNHDDPDTLLIQR
jgi:hypothetical protein